MLTLNKDYTIRLRTEPVVNINKVLNHLKKLHSDLDIKRVCSLTKKDTKISSYYVLVYEDSKGYINRRSFYA